MTVELDRYLGREQSYIKHLFLTQYLQAAGYKKMQGRSSIFNFVELLAQIIDSTAGESDLNGNHRVVTLVRHGLQIA